MNSPWSPRSLRSDTKYQSKFLYSKDNFKKIEKFNAERIIFYRRDNFLVQKEAILPFPTLSGEQKRKIEVSEPTQLFCYLAPVEWGLQPQEGQTLAYGAHR